MVVTTELSLYPLTNDYEGPILAFIKILRENEDLEVHTHCMSTYVKGESKAVFDAIETALVTMEGTISLIMKVINRDLPVKQGFLSFE